MRTGIETKKVKFLGYEITWESPAGVFAVERCGDKTNLFETADEARTEIARLNKIEAGRHWEGEYFVREKWAVVA